MRILLIAPHESCPDRWVRLAYTDSLLSALWAAAGSIPGTHFTLKPLAPQISNDLDQFDLVHFLDDRPEVDPYLRTWARRLPVVMTLWRSLENWQRMTEAGLWRTDLLHPTLVTHERVEGLDYRGGRAVEVPWGVGPAQPVPRQPTVRFVLGTHAPSTAEAVRLAQICDWAGWDLALTKVVDESALGKAAEQLSGEFSFVLPDANFAEQVDETVKWLSLCDATVWPARLATPGVDWSLRLGLAAGRPMLAEPTRARLDLYQIQDCPIIWADAGLDDLRTFLAVWGSQAGEEVVRQMEQGVQGLAQLQSWEMSARAHLGVYQRLLAEWAEKKRGEVR